MMIITTTMMTMMTMMTTAAATAMMRMMTKGQALIKNMDEVHINQLHPQFGPKIGVLIIFFDGCGPFASAASLLEDLQFHCINQ
jgi:hypothetical protein